MAARWRSRPEGSSSIVQVRATCCSASSAVTVTAGRSPSVTVVSVTVNRQNTSTPSRRSVRRGSPIHASAWVGSTLGHGV